MQNIIKATLAAGTILFLVLLQGCKKDNKDESPNSWTEEFTNFEYLLQNQWQVFNNSLEAYAVTWQQGFFEEDKMGGYLGFRAYSGNNHEYAFAGETSFNVNSVVSSWLITPSVTVKNDDKFSFYTRCDSSIISPHTLEVRLSTVAYPTPGTGPSDVGNFTQLLYTVNPAKTQDGYPKTWKKIEVTISGLSSEMKGRIAFRYVSQGQLDGGIGIDQLVYTSK